VRNRIQQYREHGSEGFTLIELLIVIIIIGILAAIVVFSVSGVTDRGNVSACKATLSEAQSAVEAYYAKNTAYPTAWASVTTSPDQLLRSVPAATGYTFTLAATGGGITVTNTSVTPNTTSTTTCP
jgi:prepilin-type N-terminal cleavage/methylation domain-containing protein